MRLIFKESVYTVQTKEEFLKTWSHIEDTLRQTEEMIAYITVNGTEIYDQFEAVILDNLEQQGNLTVSIVTQTVDEMVIDTISSLREYLSKMIPAVEKAADRFYAGPERADWEFFQRCLEGLQWISQTCEALSRLEYPGLNKQALSDVYTRLHHQLKELLKALESEQYVVVGDVLLYEMQPVLQDLAKTVDTKQVPQ